MLNMGIFCYFELGKKSIIKQQLFWWVLVANCMVFPEIDRDLLQSVNLANTSIIHGICVTSYRNICSLDDKDNNNKIEFNKDNCQLKRHGETTGDVVLITF